METYADRAVALANAPLESLADAKALLRAHTSDWYARRATDDDLSTLQAVRDQLRSAFAERDERRKVSRLNALLAAWPVTPRISGHDNARWHMHVTSTSDTSARAAHEYITSACYGLAVALTEHGADRLRVCADPVCGNAFLERNGGRSRRWCSDRCATRAHVAAYRARQKAAAN